MKHFVSFAICLLMAVSPVSAQNYTGSRYYNPGTGRLEYGNLYANSTNETYFGLRVGPSFSMVHSDNGYLDGSRMKTGIAMGGVVGYCLTDRAPLYLEGGLMFVQKGGKSENSGNKFTYTLNYLEMPLVFKYKLDADYGVTIEPSVGCYLAYGLGGKIKDFGKREAYPSFTSHEDASFTRGDVGLRFGVGVAMDRFYIDFSYDLGLSNVGRDYFNETRNHSLLLTIGVNI